MNKKSGETASLSQEICDRSAFRSWSEQAFLSPEEERGRQTTCRLAQALDVIIQEELTPPQRQVLERYWFDGEKLAQIARELGQNRSSVSRTLRRAQKNIYGSLKYAVLALRGEAQEQAQAQEQEQEQEFSLAVSQAAQVLAARGQPADTMGERIRKLRAQRALTKKQLAAALCVDEAAVSRWERDVELPDTSALMHLAQLFGVRADDILFGAGESAGSPARPGSRAQA